MPEKVAFGFLEVDKSNAFCPLNSAARFRYVVVGCILTADECKTRYFASVLQATDQRMAFALDMRCLNTLFSRKSIDRIVEYGTCPAFEEAVSRFVDTEKVETNSEALSEIFSFMDKYYRNEYYFKSMLLRKLVYGVHSPRTTSALCELPIGDSIADFVLINGKACVYEIKTELDNLSRLESQLRDYYKAFRYVSLVCSESMADAMGELLKCSPVGLVSLTSKNTLRVHKSPECWENSIDAATQFRVLRKSERDLALHKCGVSLPDTTPVRYYMACLSKFEKVGVAERVIAFEGILKARKANMAGNPVEMYPNEFKLIAYNHSMGYDEGKMIDRFLAQPI